MKKTKIPKLCLPLGLWIAPLSFAQEGPILTPPSGAPATNAGDTAWVLMSCALVLLMTPGLAFFYGGMVKTKNVVSTLFKSFSAIGVVGLLWVVCGYSMAFSPGNGIIGGLEWAFLRGIGQAPHPEYGATIPHMAFMLFQCMFAIITPALFSGAVVERVKFPAWLLTVALWTLCVYAPVAHWVWGTGGWIRELGALDFAGGLVVHIAASISALALAFAIGSRKVKEEHPYDQGYIALGTGLLLFGWMGFNGGSALGANGLSAHAAAATLFACCGAMAAWVCVDYIRFQRASLSGTCIGAIGGLVAVTPAAGYVTIPAALAIGLCTGFVVNACIPLVRNFFTHDDALDVFACHGIGGIIGTLLTGILATESVNPQGGNGLAYGSTKILEANLIATVAVVAYCAIVTFVLAKVVNALVGLRVSEDDERAGLDSTQHGEVVNVNFSQLPHYVEKIATPKNDETKKAS